MLAPSTYNLIHRSFDCSYCGARIGEKCIGRRGRIEGCHVDRKNASAEYRRENPEAYRALRDAIASNLLNRSTIVS